jgi:hypothetical protein
MWHDWLLRLDADRLQWVGALLLVGVVVGGGWVWRVAKETR